MGECEKNPEYMQKFCKKSCFDQYQVEEEIFEQVPSVYDLKANDIDGEEFDFAQLKGKVAVIVNVASYCGYTEQHYKELVQLYDLYKESNKFEILAFPSNQFGKQEPESCEKIKLFAKKEKGVQFRMMYKIDVNGENAHMVYKYLKARAGPGSIEWNFNTYFVITPDGTITSHTDVTPMQLKDKLKSLISEGDEF